MNVTVRRTITCELSADDWQLYDKPGREEAAKVASQRLSGFLTAAAMTGRLGRSPYHLWDEFDRELERLGLGRYGIRDTEGRHAFMDALAAAKEA